MINQVECGKSWNTIANNNELWAKLKLLGFNSFLDRKMVISSKDIQNNVSDGINIYER